MLIGRVEELFQLSGRGIVVILDKTYEQLSPDLKLKIGNPIAFREGDSVVLESIIKGIEICDPWAPNQKFAFLLPPDIRKEFVPINSEVWSVDPSDT
jgi:hypothetical protein